MSGALRQAWRLFRTDSRADTYAAVALVLVAFGPAVVRLWTESRQNGGERTA